MFLKNRTILKSLVFTIPLGLLSFTAVSQKKSVMDPNINVTSLQNFALVEQVPAMKGYNIRARRIVIPAGVSIGEHEHSTRPGIVYVESGSIVEYRGDKARTLFTGDSLVEDANTVHRYKNTSTQDCVLIAFDLPTIAK